MSYFGNISSSPITIVFGTIVIVGIIIYLCKVIRNDKFAQANQTLPRVIPLAPITASPPIFVRTGTASNPYAPPSYAHFGQDTQLSPQSTIVNIPPGVSGDTGTVAYPVMVSNPISPGTGQAPEPYSAVELSYQPSLYVPRLMSPTGPITSVSSQHSSTTTTSQLTPYLSATTVSSSSAVGTEPTQQEQSSNAPPPPYLEVMSENTAQATATQPR